MKKILLTILIAFLTISGAAQAQQTSYWRNDSLGTAINKTNQQYGRASVDQFGTQYFSPVPNSFGGWSKKALLAASTTVTVLKGTAGALGGYIVRNSNNTEICMQFFDVSSGTSVTLGSTTPDFVLPLPALAAANVEISLGVNFANGIKYAVTTTCSGSSAPITGLDGTLYYK